MEQVVVISGAGNLGRHLEALLKVPQRLAIYIIDPDASSVIGKKVVEK